MRERFDQKSVLSSKADGRVHLDGVVVVVAGEHIIVGGNAAALRRARLARVAWDPQLHTQPVLLRFMGHTQIYINKKRYTYIYIYREREREREEREREIERERERERLEKYIIDVKGM